MKVKIKIDEEGDVVFVIESLEEAQIIAKVRCVLLCECAYCGELCWNDEDIKFHMKNCKALLESKANKKL